MPPRISPDVLRSGGKPLKARVPLNFNAARAGLEAQRAQQLHGLGIGSGLKYGVPPTNSSFKLTAMTPLLADKGRLDWDHSEWVGIDVWGDKHPFVSFQAIGNLKLPGSFEIVQPQLNIYVENIASQLLIEVALQAHTDDGSAPRIKVWATSEQTFTVNNGKPSTISFIAAPAGMGSSASLTMENATVDPLPKNGGSWALFEVRVSPLKT